MQYRNAFNFLLSSAVVYFLVTLVPVVYPAFAFISSLLVGIRISQWLMKITRKYILWQAVCPKNKAVLITGCSSGFGHALAIEMNRLGYMVFAICRNPDAEGAKYLLKSCPENLYVLKMDVSDERSIEHAKLFVEEKLGQNVLWAVVNNAGIAHCGEIDWTSVEEIQQVYDVNVIGTLRVTKCFLPLLKKSKGRIVNVTSYTGRRTHTGFVGYCMSKSAAIALTTGLRIELAKWGVKAISIEPYFYFTRMTDLEVVTANAEKTWKTAPEEIKKEYGEEYIEYFKKLTRIVKYVSSPNIQEVIECLKDAITSREPMSAYSLGIFFFTSLYDITPSVIEEFCQRTVLNFFCKPLALVAKEKRNK